MGACLESNGDGEQIRYYIFEFASLGQLNVYLRNHRHFKMSKIINICCQQALVMAYLTSRNIVHRSLMACNVLLVNEDLSKLTEFSNAKRINEGENFFEEKSNDNYWPIKWYPPEVFKTRHFDQTSDVWSFGVMCWEAASYGSRPYQNVDNKTYLNEIEKGHFSCLKKPEWCPQYFYGILKRCWSMVKEERPTFSELSDEFKVYRIKKYLFAIFSLQNKIKKP
jgi:spleen tyrosine kinase